MAADETQRVTRLAPSPTGALHLGNARTFLINWVLARQAGWKVVFRMEDLDGPRVKAQAAEQAIRILDWLGLDWDEGPFYQSADLTSYAEALEQLGRAGRLYSCTCTRREIESAQSAPHEEDHELRYPGTCRPAEAVPISSERVELAGVHRDDADAAAPHPGNAPAVAWRVVVPDEPVRFEDEVSGPQEVNVQQQVGDFVVASKAGLPAYQLAVVVDDARQGVTDVVRGDDLLDSTARQIWLYRMLDLAPLPRYYHLPLVTGPDGRRLAKRHGDTRLTTYREQGVAAERVVGLLAYWSGTTDARQAMPAAEFAASFRLDHLPHKPATLTGEDEAWLLQR